MGPPRSEKQPASEEMAEIRGGDLTYRLFGTGGIKVSMPHRLAKIVTAGDVYEIDIDGSSLSAAGGSSAVNVASDFTASPGKAYFVSAPATCLLSTAAGVAGKEIIVCNTGSGGSITYTTTAGQTISGHSSGSLSNSSKYEVDRFISCGDNWYKE